MEIVVPGRTELAGNHTDHQGGHVLAAAVELLIHGSVEPSEDDKVILKSKGFGEFSVQLERLDCSNSRAGSAESLIRGVLEYLYLDGWNIGAFVGDLCSEIPAGAGISSSAAFSVWVGSAVSRLFNRSCIPAMTLALAARYAENRHFGKPCGLMDQCACAFGGVTAMSFHEDVPEVWSISADLEKLGYALFLVQTGGNHRDLTEDYAQIPREMRAVAAVFGKKRLSDVPASDIRSSVPDLRKRVGDRAVLRALHFIGEDLRAQEMAQYLERGDMLSYLSAMDESGRSSAEFLQNSFSTSDPGNQGISLALALSRNALAGCGAARVHGGGFAGTIQAMLPADRESNYRRCMESVFGEGSCLKLRFYKPA